MEAQIDSEPWRETTVTKHDPDPERGSDGSVYCQTNGAFVGLSGQSDGVSEQCHGTTASAAVW